MRKSEEEPKIALQERDIALLRSFLECRIMTSAQVAALHFDGRSEMAKKRLQKLKAASLLAERRRRPNERAVLYLTKTGLEALNARSLLANYPPLGLPAFERRAQVSSLTIEHELAVMDVKAAFHSALRSYHNYKLAEFGTWPKLHEFTVPSDAATGETLVRPDGFLRVYESGPDGVSSEHAFFLELDRSTETHDRLARRAALYVHHYRSGGYARTRGASAWAYKNYPFRVLMIFKTVERRDNMAQRLVRSTPPILSQVCLATIDDVVADPFGRVWLTPRDFRDVAPQTATASDNTGTLHYRSHSRQASPSAVVRKQVPLSGLFK